MEGSSHTYFGYDTKSYKVAQSVVRKLPTEIQALEYLHEAKPPFLNIGDSLLGVDIQQLTKEIIGLSDKLKIHGYFDRGDRLLYLYEVLGKKFANKEDVFKIVLKFLLEMSERPTSILCMELSKDVYSLLPDSDETEEENSEKQKLLKQILGDGKDDYTALLSYSSDSELSEWTSDDESEQSKKSTNEMAEPDRKIRISRSFSEFSDLPLARDIEEKRKEMELYWSMEVVKANNFLRDLREQREVKIIPLQNQPVISGLLALQADFGEYWEWKKNSKDGRTKYIISEEDVIREILLQFTILNNRNSPVFTSNWEIKEGLMVSSLSRSSFVSLMEVYKKTFSTLEKFKEFINSIENQSFQAEYATPKILRSYANGLSLVMLNISKEIGKEEINLKKDKETCKQEDPQPCTTLMQSERRFRSIINIVSLLNSIHKLAIENPNSSTSEKWMCSIRLISTLGMSLTLQTTPIKFGVVCFLFSKCLHAFLYEMNLAMTTLIWNDDDFVLKRDRSVKISDPHFWSDAIRQRPFQENLKESGIPLLNGIFSLIQGFHIVLKTSEMLHQLEENYTKELGIPPCADKVVDDLLNTILPFMCCDEEEDKSQAFQNLIPDYETHIKFIGLEGSYVADSMKSILNRRPAATVLTKEPRTIDQFLSLQKVPGANILEILSETLHKWYEPHFQRAKNCINRIFHQFQVDESMQLFREIILGVREDFTMQIVELSKANESKRFNYEDEMYRNPRFQKLLNDCYPEGRDNFDIYFKLDSLSDMKYTFVVKPHFPLNLILTHQSIEGYLFVSRQLQRIRKSLWETTALSVKDFKALDNVEPNRVLLFRFALIHFCSNIRAYLVFKIFAKNLRVCTTTDSYDLDAIRKIHEDHLLEIETKLLRSVVMEKVVIRKMVSMSEALVKFWTRGISSKTMILLEDTLKKCWNVVRTFQKDFNELSCHFGPPPSYL